MKLIIRHFQLFIICIACFIAGCQSQTKFITNVTERDANEIICILSSKGIAATKTPAAAAGAAAATTTEQLWDISVSSAQITDALCYLNDKGLPRPKGTTLLSLFGAQGLVPSDMQDRIRYQEGLSEQIATTIRKMDGIVDANVQVSFPRDETENVPLTASVYIKHQGVLDNSNSIIVNKIKRFVASAVPGLTVDNVSVVTDRSLICDMALATDTHQMHPQEYVSIWSVIVAKESENRFRLIFYCLLILLFLLIAALIWLVWKFYPFIDARGYRMLFRPQQVFPKESLSLKKELKKCDSYEWHPFLCID